MVVKVNFESVKYSKSQVLFQKKREVNWSIVCGISMHGYLHKQSKANSTSTYSFLVQSLSRVWLFVTPLLWNMGPPYLFS